MATQTFCTNQDAHMNLSMKAVDGVHMNMIRSNENNDSYIISNTRTLIETA